MARVVSKHYYPVGTSYYTSYTSSFGALPMSKNAPEMFSVIFNLNGKNLPGYCTKDQYEALRESQEVEVNYQKHRLTGRMQFMGLANN